MAASRALGRAFLAAGGTMVFLGGVTMLVGVGTMGVVSAVARKGKTLAQVPCTVCRSERRVVCEVCEGERILRYWPSPEPPPAQTHAYSVCAMCEGRGEHACINCVGTGTVYPLALPWEEQPHEAAAAAALSLSTPAKSRAV